MHGLPTIIAMNTTHLPEMAKDRTRSEPTREPWTPESLAIAWREGTHEPNHPAWRAYAAYLRTLAIAGTYVRVSREPYKDAAEMIQNSAGLVIQDSARLIFAGNHPLGKRYVDFDGERMLWNDVARYWHDRLGHCESGASFSLLGEYDAFRHQAKHFPADAHPALFAEIVGQAAYKEVYGTFPPVQKCVVLDPTRGVTL